MTAIAKDSGGFGMDHIRCTRHPVSVAFYTCTGLVGKACIAGSTSISHLISRLRVPCYALPSLVTAATVNAIEMVWKRRQIFTLGTCCCSYLPPWNRQTHCGSWLHFDSFAWGVVALEPL